MSSKHWLICFFSLLAALIATIVVFNYKTDPFGVFGDEAFDWYELNMTNNPAAAKIAYLDRHHGEYDSYIIGSSGTSSFPAEKLNEYTGASFFNLFSYGADMEKTYLTAKYVLENYEVKNLVVCVGIMDAINFKKYGSSVTESLHSNITDEPAPAFYLKYLFANPKYGMNKIENRNKYDTYLPRFFDIFDTKTGEYDDRMVDMEHIGALDAYLKDHDELKEENRRTYTPYFPHTDECVGRVADIKRLCDEKGAEMRLIFMPSYYLFCQQLDMTQVAVFFNKLAEVCDFWDFLLSSASSEPRYFQDYMHIRKPLGAMALARVYGDKSVYIPDDFGFYVTRENAADYAGGLWDRVAEMAAEPGRAARVDALMYHHIGQEGDPSAVISPERFEEHMAALAAAGYNTVSIAEMRDFVEKGLDLPEKALLITFDDGYLSNYEYAYPILEKYGMKAAVFMVGSFAGKQYLDLAYFGWGAAREMSEAGVFEIGGHSYDMHVYPPSEATRDGILRLPGESEEDYIAALRKDTEAFIDVYEKNMGTRPSAFAFPYGKHEKLAEAILLEYGFKVTFTTNSGPNEIIKGLPQSLYGLNRYTVSGDMSGEDLLKLIENR